MTRRPTDPAVAQYLRDLEHPLASTVEAVRQSILGASPDIHEGIKWNAPSFRTTEWFATFNLRAPDRVRLVLHLGAKVKQSDIAVPDPDALVEWLAKDRGLVVFTGDADAEKKSAALQALLREWIRWV